MPDQVARPLVGVGVVLLRNNRVLLGKRLGSHGAGQYSTPGGHLELLESFEACARRELREETGLEFGVARFLSLINVKEYAPKHFIDVTFVANWLSGEPRVLEPHKIESWDWYGLDNLPRPLFGMLPTVFEALRTGRCFWDC